MDLQSGLVALFQAPFDDRANVSNAQLASGYAAVFAALENYADSIDAIDATTEDLALRAAAGDLFVTACLCACFAALAEGLAAKAFAKDYPTADAVHGDLVILSQAWDFLSLRSFDAGIRGQLSDISTRVAAMLQGIEVTLPRLEVMDVPAMPVSVLSYYLYDSDTQEDVLVGLNSTLPPWLYERSAVVLGARLRHDALSR